MTTFVFTFMFHEYGKRPPFDSIQLRQFVFLDMCIIDMDNDFRIKIPNGDMIEKSMSFPTFPFDPRLQSTILWSLSPLLFFTSREASSPLLVDPTG